MSFSVTFFFCYDRTNSVTGTLAVPLCNFFIQTIEKFIHVSFLPMDLHFGVFIGQIMLSLELRHWNSVIVHLPKPR